MRQKIGESGSVNESFMSNQVIKKCSDSEMDDSSAEDRDQILFDIDEDGRK